MKGRKWHSTAGLIMAGAIGTFGFNWFLPFGDLIEKKYYDDLLICRADGVTPQMVVFSFDGSRSLPMWEETISVAQKTSEFSSRPVHFTYFVSGVYFLAERWKDKYVAPDDRLGVSLIGFASTGKDVSERIKLINQAIADGHEIGSHLNGHFNGLSWGVENWRQEFDYFQKLLLESGDINFLNLNGRKDFNIKLGKKDLIGFRAPELSINEHLWPAMGERGYLYDASQIGQDTRPFETDDGLWHFPLVQVRLINSKRGILPIDYNFFVEQTGVKEKIKQGTKEWQFAYDQVKFTYLDYFYKNYLETREPVYIVNHFSLWNDGVYWEVSKSLIEQFCLLPDARCVSYRELLNYWQLSH